MFPAQCVRQSLTDKEWPDVVVKPKATKYCCYDPGVVKLICDLPAPEVSKTTLTYEYMISQTIGHFPDYH